MQPCTITGAIGPLQRSAPELLGSQASRWRGEEERTKRPQWLKPEGGLRHHLRGPLMAAVAIGSLLLVVVGDPLGWREAKESWAAEVALAAAFVVACWPLMRHGLFLAVEGERCRLKEQRKPQRIVIVRHAESLGNTSLSTYASIPDNQIPLTKRGVQQARELGERMRGLMGEESCRFFVSPYQRTWQTLHELLVTMRPSLYSVREEPRVREQDWGNFQTDPGLISAQIDERRRFGSFFYRLQNGESGADVFARVDSFWASIFREFEYQDCLQNFVIITHGITARMLLMRYFGWDVKTFHALHNFENCQFAVLDKEPSGKYRLTTPIKVQPLNG